MDSLDEIESRNQRNLETAELVSAYMRANAQRAAQKAKQQAVESPPTDNLAKEQEGESDSLDFSSEFSNPDMGLSDQGSFPKLLDWKNLAVEDEDQERKDEDEDSEGDAEEWRSGSWQDKEQDSEEEDEGENEGEPEVSVDTAPSTEDPKPFLRPVGQSPILPSTTTPSVATAPPAAPPPPVAVVADASTEQPMGLSWLKPSQTSPPEPIRPAAHQGPIQLPERLRPEAHFALPQSGQAAALEPELAQAAQRLITNSPSEPGYQECVRLLARFGKGALAMCSRAKVKVEVLDEHGFGSHPALLDLGLAPEQTPSDGAYLVERRLVLIDRRSLTGRPRFFHPVLYYFAHAFDHAQGGETFASRKAAAVVACFESSVRAMNGFDFVDELAAADPVRYFARSVAVYLGKDDCSEPLWSHQDLYDFDRSMYDYLQYLFARLAA